MGVDLRLLPIDGDHGTVVNFSHNVLSLERRRELWEPIAEIEKAHGRDVPENFDSFIGRRADGETGYGRTIESPYGTPVRYVRAADLLPLAEHEAVTDNPKNHAAWAYLAALPADYKVALYWH